MLDSMGYMDGKRPDIQDTKKDAIFIMCDIIRDLTAKKYILLDNPIIRDLIKFLLLEVGMTYNPKNHDGKQFYLEKNEAITAADIATIFAASGLFAVRGKGSEIEEFDILMYNAPGATWSTGYNAYVWSPLPAVFRSGQTRQTPTAAAFSDLVYMYISNTKNAVVNVCQYLTKCPIMVHRFNKRLIPFLNGVVEYTDEKAGRLIPWSVVESLHFGDPAYMFIDWKVCVPFPFQSFDENTTLPDMPRMTLKADYTRGLDEMEITPVKFLNQIFEPEEKQEEYGDELGPQSVGFMHLIRIMLQPYGGWFPCMYMIVDATGTSNGNNGKGSIIKLINLLATGSADTADGPVLSASLARICSGQRFVLDMFKANKYIHVAPENNDLSLKTLDEAKKIFSGDLTDSEGKQQDVKTVKRRAVSVSCFNTVPAFPSDALDDSLMRRTGVLFCPNSFEGKARPAVESEFLTRKDVLTWFAVYAVMKIGFCENHVFDEAYLSRHCPIMVGNRNEFFGEVSIVATYCKEILDENPDYMCNDAYDWEYLYDYSFVPWWHSRNPRAKTVPVQRKKFKKQLAVYLRYSEHWTHSLSGKGKRLTKDMVTGQPENFIYENHYFLRDKFSAVTIEAACATQNKETNFSDSVSSRRAILDNWDLLQKKTIRIMCTSLDRKVEEARNGASRRLIYKKDEYLGGGWFKYPEQTLDEKEKKRLLALNPPTKWAM